MAKVVALPIIRIERDDVDVDLSHQSIKPSADRRKVVELRRVREEREWLKHVSKSTTPQKTA